VGLLWGLAFLGIIYGKKLLFGRYLGNWLYYWINYQVLLSIMIATSKIKIVVKNNGYKTQELNLIFKSRVNDMN
jgi:hypothetical protein